MHVMFGVCVFVKDSSSGKGYGRSGSEWIPTAMGPPPMISCIIPLIPMVLLPTCVCVCVVAKFVFAFFVFCFFSCFGL